MMYYTFRLSMDKLVVFFPIGLDYEYKLKSRPFAARISLFGNRHLYVKNWIPENMHL